MNWFSKVLSVHIVYCLGYYKWVANSCWLHSWHDRNKAKEQILERSVHGNKNI